MTATVLYTTGIDVTIVPATDAWAAQGNAVSLCGLTSIALTAGTPDEKVTNTYCKGKETYYGDDNPGTLAMNFDEYLRKDAGQMLINAATKNTRLLLTFEYSDGTKAMYQLKKKQSIIENPAKENIVASGTCEFSWIGETQWTDVP